MRIRRVLHILLFVSFTGGTVYAQSLTHYYHNLFWGRIVLADKFNDKFSWEVYLTERTQNDPAEKLSIFKYHQVTNYWLWIHYHVNKDLRVSVTPFCYFNTISYFPQPAEIGNRGVNEYRWALQLEHTQRLRHIQFANRYSIELRYRDIAKPDDFVPNYRIRYRAKLEKPLKGVKHPMSLILYDEVMFEFGKAVENSPAVFNQNRLYAGVNYEVMKNVKFGLGYMYLIQERLSGSAIDISNVLWATATFDNVFSQFSKKNANKE